MFVDGLLEPVKYYDDVLKEQFYQGAEKYFDELVKKSGIKEEENIETAKKYRAKKEEADQAADRLGKLKGWRIALIVISIVAAIVGVIMLFTSEGRAAMITIGVILLVLAVAAVVLIFTLLKKKIAEASGVNDKLQAAAQEILNVCESQMAALNALFDSSMTPELIQKAVPILKIDENFDVRRFDYMHGKYGFSDNTDETESTVDLMSGEIVGNPFIIEKRLKMTMGMETYHGSRVITYTEHYTDSDGKSHTRTVTQTLHASVTKPKPFYHTSTVLVYGNDAAPKLCFSRKPKHSENLTDKQIEKTVKKGSKQLEKKALKDATDNDPSTNYTKMGNDEFEVLFDATDRNDEIEFRLLFTVLAQRNMLTLMRSKSGYGDDFYFKKRKCLNYIKCEHAQSFAFDTSPENYRAYDVNIARKNFVSFNQNYFKNLYFQFAPALSIPLYQQQKPREYIYKNVFYRNITSYEAEHLANRIGAKYFAHTATATSTILKTELMTKSGKSDKVSVTANSFRSERRCDNVPVFGGDGRTHMVPVYWDEYIPVRKLSVMDMKELDFSNREFPNNEKAKKAASNSTAWAYYHKIFARLSKDGNAELDKEF